MIEPVAVETGDRLAVVPDRETGGGVIMEVYSFDPDLDPALLTAASPVAKGRFGGSVSFTDIFSNEFFEADIEFSFEVPITEK